MDSKNAVTPQGIAHEFVGASQNFLEQALGRECEFKELADFAETVGTTVLGSMFALIREKEGKEASEKWLQKAMATMSGTIRLAGADALVRADITVKDMPNKMPKRDELHVPGSEVKVAPPAPAAAEEAEAPKCKCKVEEDQSCLICLRVISVATLHAFRNTIDMVGIAAKLDSVCEVCKVRHGDEAISKLVPEIMKAVKEKKATLEQGATIAAQLGMTLGVQDMPLTREGLKEAAEESVE
jgi:hypothetical protein